MTDQLERDLTRLFQQRADQSDVPPIPLDLIAAEPRRQWGRRAVIGLVAAAAVAAVAVPLGLNARDDGDVAPPAKDPITRHGLELPYLFENELHVGDLALPVKSYPSLQVAGTSVLVTIDDLNGGGVSWDRLAGDHLVDLPFLDGVFAVQTSYDGSLVAAPVGSDLTTGLRVWDTSSGAVVDTFTLAGEISPEDQWLWGFDAAGWLYWQDGDTEMARTPQGNVVTVDVDAGDFAGLFPGGILLRTGSTDTVTLATVSEDGSVDLGAEVPVSANAAWLDSTTVAYQAVGTGRVYVLDVTTGEQVEVTVKDRTSLTPVGWNGNELVVSANWEGIVNYVVAVDPSTGKERALFEYGPDDPYPFGPTGGTGAL
ncbi:MAG: hypothetical protein NTX33_05615 [Propionibacteriales bacterium]|nr:hypothetical protein [Propionibacteriales bacterium]